MAAIQGQGPGLCHCAIPRSGNLLLLGLIYSKDHLGPENNVFCDLELVIPSLLHLCPLIFTLSFILFDGGQGLALPAVSLGEKFIRDKDL